MTRYGLPMNALHALTWSDVLTNARLGTTGAWPCPWGSRAPPRPQPRTRRQGPHRRGSNPASRTCQNLADWRGEEASVSEVGDERVQSLSASGIAAHAAPVKPGETRPYLRLDHL